MTAPAAGFAAETESFTRALLARISSGGSVATQAVLVQAGVQATRELVELQRVGLEVSAATLAFAFEQLGEGLDRLLELFDQELVERELEP